jgi:hypothetical protein
MYWSTWYGQHAGGRAAALAIPYGHCGCRRSESSAAAGRSSAAVAYSADRVDVSREFT